MSVRTIHVETNASGEYTYERRMAGVIKGISVDVGDLETPDIAISDGTFETEILTLTGVAADDVFQPSIPAQDEDGLAIADAFCPPAIMGTLKVEVTGGGANKTGTVRVLFD